MSDLTVFEAGMRSESGKYETSITSSDKSEIDNYIEIMKEAKPEGMTIVRFEKRYRLIITTGLQIIGE